MRPGIPQKAKQQLTEGNELRDELQHVDRDVGQRLGESLNALRFVADDRLRQGHCAGVRRLRVDAIESWITLLLVYLRCFALPCAGNGAIFEISISCRRTVPCTLSLGGKRRPESHNCTIRHRY